MYIEYSGALSDNLIISPSTPEIVRFVNDSHIVTCSGNKGVKILWQNPKGEILLITKGRIHVEEISTRGIENVALVFETINVMDAGYWFCHIKDTATKRFFRLVVNEEISFMDTPTLQNTTENNDVTIRCGVKGIPEPSAAWYYSGKKILFPHEKYTKLADGLLIRNVTKNQSGEYTCRAYQISDKINEYDEKTIKLTVHHKPICIQVEDKDNVKFGYLNGYVNLTCICTAKPRSIFSWYNNFGTRMDNQFQLNTQIFNDDHISVLQVFINDSKLFGKYTCTGRNNLGFAESTIVLTEGKRPDLPNKFEIQGFNSDSVSIDVEATGSVDIVKYRFDLLSDKEYKEKETWNTAHRYEFPTANGKVYLISGLNQNTTYLIRAASYNLAGSSEYTESKVFTTLPMKLPVSSGYCLSKYSLLMLRVLYVVVAVFPPIISATFV
ncbi:neural cell adhesion molecule 2-like [Culicoides brevitarsis]|uniref:neural cell adhesion molecule 2-like n=1 Tax=Culicoides brevitarsis TaxID=469753 RepID=UPI00307BC1AE